ncbi:MAG TPA: endonuclease/exonuclease/phosphatase family protein [Solirubrobacteraceae bacterium]|nr:endonuclease/exonuclease/phosphatase family protein [Solirubrobacteraceae bacterium]
MTWNVAGRVGRLEEQAAAVAAVHADLVALQEVTRRTAPLWRQRLAAAGLPHVRCALDDLPAQPPGPDPGRRPLGVLVAARDELRPLAPPAGPWPERTLAAAARLDGEPVAVLAVHAPISQRAHGVKVLALEAIGAWLAARPERRVVLLGDLNTPRREHPDGTVMTFARDRDGTLRADRGERHDDAERGVTEEGLRGLGFADTFRAVHGWEAKERSWTYPNGGGYRLDHVLVRGAADVRAAAYAHELRAAGLSDHSALAVDLAF